MNIKIIIHFIKHFLWLKRNSYLCFFLVSILLLLFKFSSKYFTYPRPLVVICVVAGVFLAAFFLFSSSFLPGVKKDKSNESRYSNKYILSTFRFVREFLTSVAVEFLIDVTLFGILLWIMAHNWLFLLSCSLAFGVFASLDRFGKLISISSSVRRKEKLKIVLPVVTTVVFGILFVVNKIYPYYSMSMLLYILTPVWVMFSLASPIILFLQLTEDLNSTQLNSRNQKISSAMFCFSLFGAFVYYLSSIKTGQVLFEEIAEGNVGAVNKIITKNKSVLNSKESQTGLRPLLYAGYENKFNVVQLLINMDEDINEKSDEGINLLMYASYRCNLEVSKSLVNQGIDYNAVTRHGRNALFFAAESNCIPLIVYFKGLKMNENQLDNKKQTYIEYGAAKNPEFKKVMDVFAVK